MNETLAELKSVLDFEKCSLKLMNENAKRYFSAEACQPSNRGSNEKAFRRYQIRPRVLRGVAEVNLDCKILGRSTAFPIGISPTGIHSLAHVDAEKATASGCCSEECIFILSSVSSCPIRELREKVTTDHTKLWMQVYIHRDRSETLDLVKKAESLGFSAIVVTVDGCNGGLWRKNMPDSFFGEVKQRFSNVSTYPRLFIDPSITFEDLKWLKENTSLPVVVKGILTGEDAREAVQCGVSAIFVSNHGARMIERVVPTIDALEEVVNAVKDCGVDVYIDGGIRCGTDIFVALALGAKGVFIGRPAIWALSVGGEEGVRKILQILKEETSLTMQLAGASRIEDIERSMVVKVP